MNKNKITSLNSLLEVNNFLKNSAQFTAKIHPIFGGRTFRSSDKKYGAFKLDDLVKRIETLTAENKIGPQLSAILGNIDILENKNPKANRFARWVTKLRRNHGRKRYDRSKAILRLRALISKPKVNASTPPHSPSKPPISPFKSPLVKELKIFMEIDSEQTLISKLLETNQLEKNPRGLSQLNLTTDASKRLIQGIILNCNERQREMTTTWVINHKTYGPDVLEALLDGYLQLDQQEKPVQFGSLFSVVNSIKQIQRNFTPSQLETIDNAVALLIKLESESNPLQRLIEWMIQQNLVTINSCRCWAQSFRFLYSRRALAERGNNTPQPNVVRALPGIIRQLCQDKGWDVQI